MERTTVYLTDDLREGIKEIARRRDMSEALVIREALGAYIAHQERPIARSIGSLKQPEPRVNAADAKQWVHAQWDRAYDERRQRTSSSETGRDADA